MAAGDLYIPLFAFLSVVSPLLYGYVTNRNKLKEKQIDWARQDEVARRLEESGRTTNNQLATTNDKLEQIHALVNSNLTTAMENELAAVVAQLRQMEAPEAVTNLAVIAIKERIAALRALLADRGAIEQDIAVAERPGAHRAPNDD